ncbi:MAG: hypothetical protein V1754_05780, partial [Pseudomonadota bacterium]
MRFANPQLLWLLSLLPFLVVSMALRYGWRRRMLANLGYLPQVLHLADSVASGRRLFKSVLFVSGLA